MPRPTLYIVGPYAVGAEGVLGAEPFDAAAELLRGAGYEVVNPIDKLAEVDHDALETTPHTTWLRRSLLELLNADAAVYLEGWRETRDSQLEGSLCKTLGCDFGSVAWWVARQDEWT